MEDDVFLDRIKAKIERLTGRKIHLELDTDNGKRLEIEADAEVPKVVIGSDVLQYAGFARLAVEYAVASIRRGGEISQLEFQALLSRN